MSMLIEVRELRAEIERLRAVADAARKMPRWTPKGGAASTKHTYQIPAADTWALDAALKALDQADEQKAEPRDRAEKLPTAAEVRGILKDHS